MIQKPNDNELSALLHFGVSETGRTILKWLQTCDDQLRNALIKEDNEIVVRRLQGSLLTIKDIVHYLTQAREIQAKRSTNQ